MIQENEIGGKSNRAEKVDDYFVSPYSSALVWFGVCTFLVAIFLASQLGTQAKFFDNMRLERQPGLWSAIGIVGMLFFGFFQMLQFWFHRNGLQAPGFVSEAMIWLKAGEYVLWFMVYVSLVPLVGYLPTTVGFLLLMTWRLGYRQRRFYGLAVLAGVLIVVVFKSFLQVKIPGAALYEYLPSAVRSFAILYL
ncbi:tripartite tricarboxylate transporter TctB family protein [Maritalea mediterranea]|uniref:Tripartite tricarboxylate transporter TctB family protein n=1 Tax=Maritalea mediterranea TaxID=2909667 RepID=A0ABS9EAU2_9HYPH|nr:tripartite tricarboxylate transporter TctB family protein [Maritalea mediterranea]MCF4099309.1 tripartite tricarboxylate transporter TctB family protein [Maritalea mediterranea]